MFKKEQGLLNKLFDTVSNRLNVSFCSNRIINKKKHENLKRSNRLFRCFFNTRNRQQKVDCQKSLENTLTFISGLSVILLLSVVRLPAEKKKKLYFCNEYDTNSLYKSCIFVLLMRFKYLISDFNFL